jgi:DNA repair exonuclease SbcCD ATPase subunit
MAYNNPYIKVTWQDTPENFTSEKISRVKSYFQKKYNSKHVQIITKVVSNTEQTKLKSLDITENISDSEYQKTLMKDFIEENKIDVSWERIDKLDNKVNEELLRQNGSKVRYNKWYIKKIEFSNFLSYGQNNVIEFTDLPGITVVESTPKNFGGKSTATVDLLMYLFFNETTKTKTNIEIFNRFTDVDTVHVKGYVTIDGDDYVIERKSIRKKGRSGDYTVTNSLEFHKINPDGSVDNLNGEQRRETEEFISSAIGNKEDFLSTILTTGYNLEELIESKPTARGQILTKFLGLETLKQKEDICKNIQSEWSKTMVSNRYNILDVQTEIETFKQQIIDSEGEIIKQQDDLKTNETNLTSLEIRKEDALKRRNNDIDQDLIRTNPDQLRKDISDLTSIKTLSLNNAKSVEVKEPSQYYLEDEHEKVKTEVNGVIVEIRVNTDAIKRQENLVHQLEKGSICPTCNRPLDQVDHTEEINKIKDEIENLKKIQSDGNNKLVEVTEREKVFATLKKEYDEYERNKLKKAKYELEAEQKQTEIDRIQTKLDNYDRNKQKLDENIKIDSELTGLKTQIETANANIRVINTTIERLKNNINNLTDKIRIDRKSNV